VNEFAAQHPILAVALPKIVVLLFVLLTSLAYLTWFERKVVAHIQAALGTYRVGRTGCCSRWRTDSNSSSRKTQRPRALTNSPIFLRRFGVGLAITSIAVIPFDPKSSRSSASRRRWPSRT